MKNKDESRELEAEKKSQDRNSDNNIDEMNQLENKEGSCVQTDDTQDRSISDYDNKELIFPSKIIETINDTKKILEKAAVGCAEMG